MWVFLDIDGVLVPEKSFQNSMGSQNLLKFDPVCLELFENILEEYPNVSVGICSSWRDLFSLEMVRSFFSPNIASRIAGFTPLLDSENDEVYQYYRYQEVQEFLKIQNSSEDDWVAIDDNKDYYPSDTNVVVTDAYNGFDRNAASILKEYLSALKNENLSLCTA